MTIFTPGHNLLESEQKLRAAKTAARIQRVKLTLAFAAAGVSLLFGVLQLPRAATSSFAQMDASATLHRPPPVAFNSEAAASPRGLENSGQVLGLSTISGTSQPKVLTSTDDIERLINSRLDYYMQLLPGFLSTTTAQSQSSSNFGNTNTGIVQNTNGQTTAVIGGQPIVSYIPPVQSSGYSGGSIAGFTQLSAQNFSAQSAVLTGSLTASTGSFSGQLSSGPLTVSGNVAISGTLSAATSTLSSLTVSGPATFSGSTTIAGLTVTGLNPGLLQGSVAFQGAAGLSQDNTNFFYDQTNHRLGLGTTTPGSQLVTTGGVQFANFGTGLLHTSSFGVLSSSAVNLASADVSGLLSMTNGGTGAASLSQYNLLAGNNTGAIATITPGTVFQVLRSAGSSAYPVYSDIGSLLTAGSNISITGTSTIAVAGSPSFTGTTTVANLVTTGNVGIGTTTPGSLLTVAGNANITGALTIAQFNLSDGGNPTNTILIGDPRTVGTGSSNTAFGVGAYGMETGYANRGSGTNNVAIGRNTMFEIRTGASNTALGDQALFSNTVGSNNTGMGALALYAATGSSMVGVGYRALVNATSDFSVAVGYLALANLTSGVSNVAVGSQALTNATTATGNVAVGDSALISITANGGVNLHGDNNTAIGSLALYAVTAGFENTCIGFNCGQAITTGYNDTGIGGPAMEHITTGHNDTAIGVSALEQTTTGSGDTGIGQNAGWNAASDLAGFGNTTGSNNTFIGFNTGPGSVTQQDHMTVIGADAVGSCSNCVVLGRSTDNLGIGTTTPTLGPLTMASGAYVTSGGVWTNASDRNLKENFATMSPATILGQIDQLSITQWNYKNESPSIKHIGPVAQDFYALFNVGNSNTSISTIDPAGIALLGIQGLDQKITALQGSLTGNATASTLSVYFPSNFSGDSVGQAQIKPGATSVRVTFRQPYAYQPIVTITPIGLHALIYGIDNIDSTGFTIEIATNTPGLVTSESVTFDWHSFASQAAQLTVSDGTTAPIQLVVATAAQASATAALSLPLAPSDTAVSASSSPAISTSTPDTSLPQASQASSTPQVLGASTSTPVSTQSPSPTATPTADQVPVTTAPTPNPVTSESASPTPAPAAAPISPTATSSAQ